MSLLAPPTPPREKLVILVTWAAPHFSFSPFQLQILPSPSTEPKKILHETRLQTLNYSTSQTLLRQFSWLNSNFTGESEIFEPRNQGDNLHDEKYNYDVTR
jgi:hypothetical protein